MAAKTALAQIERALPKLPADHPLVAIAGDLRQLSTAPDSVLLATNRALTRFLPMQLDQLRTALSAKPVTLESRRRLQPGLGAAGRAGAGSGRSETGGAQQRGLEAPSSKRSPRRAQRGRLRA